MKHAKPITLFLLLAILPLNAYPWGMRGHYIAGNVTDYYLTPKAKAKVAALLSNATVAQLSTWGDFVRSDPDFKGKDNWHYTNFTGELSKGFFVKDAMRQDKGQNVYRVGWLIEELKKNPNDTISLKLLIHLVQDLHCPMHLGRPSDLGGNTVQITWFGEKTNLHALWDDKLIDSQRMSYTEYGDFLIRTVAPHIPLVSYEKEMEIEWAWATYQITEQIYRDRSEINRYYEYIFRYKAVWEQCLATAGVHLAAILNTLYE